jgi:hypothetical protein
MPISIKRSSRAKPSLHRLSAEVTRLRARVLELEDIRDLNAAMARNQGKPGLPWAQAKKQLGLAEDLGSLRSAQIPGFVVLSVIRTHCPNPKS